MSCVYGSGHESGSNRGAKKRTGKTALTSLTSGRPWMRSGLNKIRYEHLECELR
jgi:hypothetical protein